MKTTRKRFSADFKAKVALAAIRGDLALVEPGTEHGIHHTMIAACKGQTIDGTASTFAGTSEVAPASGGAEIGRGFFGMPRSALPPFERCLRPSFAFSRPSHSISNYAGRIGPCTVKVPPRSAIWQRTRLRRTMM